MTATEIADLTARGGDCIPATEHPNGTDPTTVDCTGMDQATIDHGHAGGGICDPRHENPATQPAQATTPGSTTHNHPNPPPPQPRHHHRTTHHSPCHDGAGDWV